MDQIVRYFLENIKFIDATVRFQYLIQLHHHDYLDFIKDSCIKFLIHSKLYVLDVIKTIYAKLSINSRNLYSCATMSRHSVVTLVRMKLFVSKWMIWMLWSYTKTYCKQVLNENLLHIYIFPLYHTISINCLWILFIQEQNITSDRFNVAF